MKIKSLFFCFASIFYLNTVARDIDTIYLASLCYSCHEADSSFTGSIASLTGYDKKKFLNYFQNIKKSKNTSKVMYQIAQAYSEREIELLSEFFSLQK